MRPWTADDSTNFPHPFSGSDLLKSIFRIKLNKATYAKFGENIGQPSALSTPFDFRYLALFWKQMKQEAPLPRRAQRVRRSYLVYFMTFRGRKSVDG